MRARQSAEIIAFAHSVKFTEHEVLIVVTHYEYVIDFPEYIGANMLDTSFRSYVIEKGEVWVSGCEAKTLTHVR